MGVNLYDRDLKETTDKIFLIHMGVFLLSRLMLISIANFPHIYVGVILCQSENRHCHKDFPYIQVGAILFFLFFIRKKLHKKRLIFFNDQSLLW